MPCVEGLMHIFGPTGLLEADVQQRQGRQQQAAEAEYAATGRRSRPPLAERPAKRLRFAVDGERHDGGEQGLEAHGEGSSGPRGEITRSGSTEVDVQGDEAGGSDPAGGTRWLTDGGYVTPTPADIVRLGDEFPLEAGSSTHRCELAELLLALGMIHAASNSSLHLPLDAKVTPQDRAVGRSRARDRDASGASLVAAARQRAGVCPGGRRRARPVPAARRLPRRARALRGAPLPRATCLEAVVLGAPARGGAGAGLAAGAAAPRAAGGRGGPAGGRACAPAERVPLRRAARGRCLPLGAAGDAAVPDGGCCEGPGCWWRRPFPRLVMGLQCPPVASATAGAPCMHCT